MARFAVIGAGAWGTALACHAARLGHAVTMWAFESEVAAEITGSHANSPYLPDVELPESITASTDGWRATTSSTVGLSPASQRTAPRSVARFSLSMIISGRYSTP